MDKNPAKYLDRILEILAKNFGSSMSIQDIQNELTPVSIFGTTGKVTFSLDLLVDSQHALDYLIKQNLVEYNAIERTVYITFEGYMKIKTKGFSKEVSEKNINLFLQRAAWILPIIISSLALYFSLQKQQLPIEKKDKLECSKSNKACP